MLYIVFFVFTPLDPKNIVSIVEVVDDLFFECFLGLEDAEVDEDRGVLEKIAILSNLRRRDYLQFVFGSKE